MEYYKEEIVKNTPERKAYADGIEKYLQTVKDAKQSVREKFISPEKYLRDPEFYREKFISMLGFPLTEKSDLPELTRKEFVAKDGNVNIYRLTFSFFGCVPLYGIYFEQVEKAAAPLCVCFHGKDGTPELISSIHLGSANYNNLVRRITDGGANAFVPQFLLWNKERYGGEYEREETDGKLRQLGGSMTAFELYLARGCVDWFIANGYIGENGVGTAGMSYGGMFALFFAAVDTRVKACYSSSWVCDGFVRSWPDWSYFGAQNTFAVAETMALVCPRPLAVGMGNRDELFDFRLTEKECDRAREFYKAFGKQDDFKLVVFDGTHEVDKGDEETGFFLHRLFGRSE